MYNYISFVINKISWGAPMITIIRVSNFGKKRGNLSLSLSLPPVLIYPHILLNKR